MEASYTGNKLLIRVLGFKVLGNPEACGKSFRMRPKVVAHSCATKASITSLAWIHILSIFLPMVSKDQRTGKQTANYPVIGDDIGATLNPKP